VQEVVEWVSLEQAVRAHNLRVAHWDVLNKVARVVLDLPDSFHDGDVDATPVVEAASSDNNTDQDYYNE
jgi:hypothetical protein